MWSRTAGVLALAVASSGCSVWCPAGCEYVSQTTIDVIGQPTTVTCAGSGAFPSPNGATVNSCQYKQHREVESGTGTCAVNTLGFGHYTCLAAGTCVVREWIANERLKCLCEAEKQVLRLPFQVWPSLFEEVEGLVFAAPSAARPTYSWMHHLEAHDNYWFSVNGLSPQALYWPSTGPSDGHNFLSNWRVRTRDGQEDFFNAAMFGPTTGGAFGLWATAHIVQLEVNRGQGSDRNIHFVATDTQVKDNTPGYPVSPAGTLDVMWHLAEQHFAGLSAAIDTLYTATEQQLNPNNAFTHTRHEQTIGGQPSWYPREKCLRATFFVSVDGTLQGPPPSGCRGGHPLLAGTAAPAGTMPGPPTGPGPFPFPCPAPRFTFGVQAGITYEQCGCGPVTVKATYAPKAFWPKNNFPTSPVRPVGPPTRPVGPPTGRVGPAGPPGSQ